MTRGEGNVPGRRGTGRWILFFVFLITSRSAALFGDNSPSVGFSPYREYSGFLPFEASDTMSGNGILSFPLFVLPQMGGWNLSISLVYNSMKTCGGPILDCYATIPGNISHEQKNALGGCWDINLGRLQKRRFPYLTQIYFVAELPDGSRQVLFPKDTYWRSKDNWTVTRLSDGVPTLYSPDGMRYVFGAVDPQDVKDLVEMDVSKIVDPYGNAVQISYTGSICGAECIRASVYKITDTCGRVIDFVYSESSMLSQKIYTCNFQLDKIIARNGGAPVCTYAFTYSTRRPTVGVSAFLYKWLALFTCVEEGLAWRFEYATRNNSRMTAFWPTYELAKVTTPSLATINYTYKDSPITSDCVGGCANRPLLSKVISGYQYDSPKSTWVFDMNLHSKITCPEGKRHEYDFIGLGGCTAKYIYDNDTLLQKEEYTWDAKVISSTDPSFPNFGGYKLVLRSKTVKRGSSGAKAYTTSYSSFDSHYRPGTIMETGDVTRKITRDYWSNGSKFMIDDTFVEKEIITVNGQTYANVYRYNSYGKVVSKTLNAQVEFRGNTFGGVTTTYTYDAQGNLAEVQDANGHETRYLNYSFGLPRDITYGTMNDGATQLPGYYTEHREYTWHGNVGSFQDGEGHLTTYDYDSLGRLKYTKPPVGAETNVYYAPHGGYVLTQKVSNGAVIDSSYQLYNSLGQLSGTYDPETNVCTDIRYDGLGRKRFESYPYIGTRTITDRVSPN